MEPVITAAITAHWTPTKTSCSGTWWVSIRFSQDQHLLFWESTPPLRWQRTERFQSLSPAHTPRRYQFTKFSSCVHGICTTHTHTNLPVGYSLWVKSVPLGAYSFIQLMGYETVTQQYGSDKTTLKQCTTDTATRLIISHQAHSFPFLITSTLHYSPLSLSLQSVFHLSARYKQCYHSHVFLFLPNNCILQSRLLGWQVPQFILLPVLCLPNKISHVW
jgi:hypothetical protein